MSDYFVRFIPEDPDFVPHPGIIKKLKQKITELEPEADKVVFQIENHIEFVDAGGNWEGVICPVCREHLSDEWWSDATSAAYETKFSNLIVTTPCCNSSVSLNDLDYIWPVGFARFIIEIQNPEKTISLDDQSALEGIIGCKLRRIDTHYQVQYDAILTI